MMKLIEEMRKQKIVDQARIREEQRLKLGLVSKKRNKKPKLIRNHSYAIDGEYIATTTFNKLPDIAVKCGAEQREDSARKLSRKLSKKLTRKLSLIEGKFSLFNEEPEEIISYGTYDFFIPVLGVTFTESGKEPKLTQGFLSQCIGRMTRLEFKNMAGESIKSSYKKTWFAPQSTKNLEMTSKGEEKVWKKVT
jgi:hypothetical protein